MRVCMIVVCFCCCLFLERVHVRGGSAHSRQCGDGRSLAHAHDRLPQFTSGAEIERHRLKLLLPRFARLLHPKRSKRHLPVRQKPRNSTLKTSHTYYLFDAFQIHRSSFGRASCKLTNVHLQTGCIHQAAGARFRPGGHERGWQRSRGTSCSDFRARS